MKLRALPVALLVASVVLAGCVGDEGSDVHDGIEGHVDANQHTLKAGTGAIAGLLVDDRFRPLHLVENPQSEFQASGFVLLHELGRQARTNADGEFTFLDIPPGTYTLRTQVSGHESTPQTIRVEEGVFNEASIVARRTASEGSFILTQEYSIFIDCWTAAPVFLWTEQNCFLDMSLDSKRGGFRTEYTGISDITYMVAEYLFNQPDRYRVQVGFGPGELVEETWAAQVVDGDYGRLLLSVDPDEARERDDVNGHLDVSRQVLTVVFPLGHSTPAGNLGFGIGTKAQVLQSIFLGEPEVDVAAYCVLC